MKEQVENQTYILKRGIGYYIAKVESDIGTKKVTAHSLEELFKRIKLQTTEKP